MTGVMTPHFCTQCGAALRPGVKFCEACGNRVGTGDTLGESMAPSDPVAHVNSTDIGERLIGQMPCAWILDKKGLFGGQKTRQGNLLITNRRLVFLHETSQSNDEEVFEDERLDDEARKRGIELRELVRDYDWFGGPGKRFLESPVDELLGENRDNWEVPVGRVREVAMWPSQEDSPDQLQLRIEGDSPRSFLVFRAAIDAVAGWLRPILGAGAVVQESW